MSKQWTIENDTGEELTVRAPNGFAVELDANSADPRERFAYFAIRQQASGLDQLRTDLAAAVAERDEWCRRAKLSEAKEALAEARLAAIDGAPTVATVCVVPSTQRVYVSADVEQYELPPIGTHLIARPAKD